MIRFFPTENFLVLGGTKRERYASRKHDRPVFALNRTGQIGRSWMEKTGGRDGSEVGKYIYAAHFFADRDPGYIDQQQPGSLVVSLVNFAD
jgi:hypothetical protein